MGLIDRKYSVEEIDRMRKALSMKLDAEMRHQWGGTRSGVREARVEEQLRTFMLNGTRPEEMEEAARLARAEEERIDAKIEAEEALRQAERDVHDPVFAKGSK